MSLGQLESQQLYAVDLLVGPSSDLIPEAVIPQRRQFFRHLVLINTQRGIPLISPPFISKLPVDLHRLYISVLRRGGFVMVTKSKGWKALCSEANPQLTESSAAGYQLRLSYQKYLLVLECNETGQDLNELMAYTETLKRKKKDDPEFLAKKLKEGLEDDGMFSDSANEFPQLFNNNENIDVVGLDGDVKQDMMAKRRAPKASSTSTEQSELDRMALKFKTKRLQLKYSQKEVAESICGCFNTDISQTTVSRFETCKLSARNMKSVKVLLDDWVEKVDEALAEGKSASDFLKETKQSAAVASE